jgi:hypothetical protein
MERFSTTAVLEAPAQARPAPGGGLLAYPLAWLALILVVATALRLGALDAPLQQDECGPLYAVAEHRPASAGASAPLAPVSDLAEVRRRSVLPYGIEDPFPLYHALLHLLLRALPIAEWSLRLPSLLAGLGCVLAIYALARRLAAPSTALAAALFTALDPMQVAVSVMARPYALASLACVLSFLALLALLRATRPGSVALTALGYGLALAVIGYLNPALLLVGAAQLSLAAGALLVRRPARAVRAFGLLAAVALTAGLLAPRVPYLAEVRSFYQLHRDYLACFGPPRLLFFAFHNAPILLALVLAAIANLRSARTARLAQPGRTLLLLGAAWLLLPQLAAVLVYHLGGQSLCLSRYLSYTSLGGALVLAVLATRPIPAPQRLLGVSAGMLGLWAWGTTPAHQAFSRCFLQTDPSLGVQMRALPDLERQGLLQEGDAVLLRPGLVEADFLPELPPEARRHVEGVSAAPLRTLWPAAVSRPVVVLSLSHGGPETGTSMQAHLPMPSALDNAELAARLGPHRRFWFVSPDWDRAPYLASFLPWLARSLKCPLRCSEVGGLTLVERVSAPPPRTRVDAQKR